MEFFINFITYKHLAFFLKQKKKKEFFIPCIVVVDFLGQVVLWSEKVKYILHLSEGISDLKRKFLALFQELNSVRIKSFLSG